MNKPVRPEAIAAATVNKTVDELLRSYRPQMSYRTLEPRMAFDGAAAATAAATADAQQPAASAADKTAAADSKDTATVDSAVPHAVADTADAAPDHTGHEAQTDLAAALQVAASNVAAGDSKATVVFIDQDVENIESIVANINPNAEVVLINDLSSGLDQMASYLNGRSDIGSIHVVSHGAAGTLYIGADALTTNTLADHRAALDVIGNSLADSGDILLYGCDVGNGTGGMDFVRAFAAATNADVAASIDDTGGTAAGGDWVLEATAGSIEAESLSNPLYAGLLVKTNTGVGGAWALVSGTTYKNTTDGVTTTITFTSGSGAFSAFIPNEALNTASGFFDNSAQGTGAIRATWGTAHGQDGTITITFDKPVTNPVLHLDRLGGNFGLPGNYTSNSSVLTLQTVGATLTRLSGSSSAFVVDSGTGRIYRAVDVAVANNGEATTSATGASAGTAAGSVQVNGTFTTLTFKITDMASTADFGGDAIEFAFAIDAPPTAANDTFTTVHDTPVTINVRTNDSDIRGDVINVSKVNGTSIVAGGPGVAVTGGTVTLVAGNLVFTPAANYTGAPSFTYTVADANGGEATATVTGTVTDIAPIVDLNYNPTSATPTITTPTAAANLLTNGSFESGATTWTNPTNLEVSSNPGTYGAPAVLAGNGSNFLELEGSAINSQVGAISQNISTVAGDVYVWKLDGTTRTNAVTGNDMLTVQLGTSTSATQTLGRSSWTTHTGVLTATSSNDVFRVASAGSTGTGYTSATDGSGGLVDGIIVQKLANNDAQTTNNRSAISVSAAQGLLVNDSNLFNSATALSVTAINGVPANVGATITLASGATLVVSANGSYTFNPNGRFDYLAAGATTTETFTYTMNDGDGNVATATATITIVGLTDSAAGTGYATTFTENGPAVAIASTNTTVGDADDSNMESATITLTNAQSGDRLLVNGSSGTTGTIGSITWTRTDTSVTFTGSATEAQYAAALQQIQFENTTDTPATVARTINVIVNDGSLNSNTAVATINIDRAPDPVNDAFSGNEDTAISGNVATNDTDLGDGGGAFAKVTSPANGTLTSFNTSTGAFVYTPNADFNGTDTFTYRYTDADGDTKTATVTLTVNPVNDAPVNIVPGAKTTAEDTALAITGVSVNDVDGATVSLTTTLSLPVGVGKLNIASSSGVTVAGDGTGTVTITGTAAAINAAIATITYTPAADYNGGTSMTVSTSDGIAAAVVNTVAITVTPVADIVNDSVTTNEDTAVTVNVLANDNFESSGAAVTSVTQPAHGTVTIGTGGNVIYTPAANYNGPDSFTYTVTSGGVTETATVNVSVAAVNDAPVNTLPAAQTTSEDTAKVITGVSVSDVDGGTLTTTVSLPAGTGKVSVVTGGGATITNNGSGAVTISGTAAQVNAALASITYTPAADYNTGSPAAPINLTVATSDGTVTTTGTVALTVTPVADIVNDSITTAEDTGKTFNVLTGTNGASADNFENAGRVVSSVTQPANGTVSFAADGTITYTPSANYNGTDTFTYTVTSGGVTETATVTVTVSAVNDAPVNAVPGPQTGSEDTSIVFSTSNGNAITVTDVDGSVTTTLTIANGRLSLGSISGVTVTGNDTGTVTVSGTPAAVTAALNGLRFAPTPDWNGATTLSVSTSDGVAAAVASTVAITVNPVVDIAPDTQTTAEDTATTFNVLTNDSFENSGATVSAVTQPAHGTVSIGANGKVTYTPAANYNGSDSFTYTVTSGGVTETTTVTLTVTPVNDAPTALAPFARTSVDGATASYAVGGFFSDADGDALTFSATGLPPGLTINATTGQISGTIGIHASTGGTGGVYSVTVTAKDPSGATVSRTFSWTVTNPAPSGVNDSFTGSEDTPISGNVLTNDTDPEGDALHINTTPVSAPAHGTLVLNSNGTFTYTPDSNYNGSDSFTYQVIDADGATSTATVTLFVNPVNDSPVNAVPATQPTPEDSPLVFSSSTGNALAVTDADSASITTTVSVAHGTLTLGSVAGVTVSGNGTGAVTISGSPAAITAALNGLTYVNTPDYNGPDTLNMVSTDGIGTSTASVGINVTAVADIAADSIATNEDASISFNVLTGTNGATADSFEGSPVVSSFTQPSHGTVTVAADGSVTYTPVGNYNGPDSFTYTVTSGGVTETTTVNITVNAVNDAPTQVLPPAQTGTEDTTVTFSGANGNQIVINDVDAGATVTTTVSVPAGSLTAISTIGVTITGNGSGTVTLSGTPAAVTAALNGLAYAPLADANGSVTLTVSTTDGTAAAVTGTVGISLSPVADIVNDSTSTSEDTAKIIAVLGNDTFENPARAVTSVTNGANGAVTINDDGTLTYTPNENFNGTDSFTYTVTSGGVTETATVTVVVNAVNDAPTQIVPAAQSTPEDGTLTFSGATGNAITVADVDGGNLTTTVSVTNGTLDLGAVTGVTVTGNGTGTVVLTGSAAAINAALDGLMYKPTADYNGGAVLTVNTNDGVVSANNTVALSVTPVADIAADTVSTNEDTAVTINVLTNDTFENSGAAVTSVTQGAHGTVTIGSGGQLTYTPAANYNGADSFSYTVTSGGVTETVTVSVDVAPVNDAPVTVVPAGQATNEDSGLVFSSGNGNAITVTDIDGDTISVTLSGTNGLLTLGSTAGVTVAGNGTATVTLSGSAAAVTAALNGLSFAPSPDYNGVAAINVTTSDGTVTSSQSIGITVNPVADIVADTIATNEDTPVTFNVLSNDTFESPGRAVTGITQGASGTVSFLADGTIVYTPDANFHGTDTFTYTVTSGGVTETTTVTVNVADVNDIPTTTGLADKINQDGQTVSVNVAASFADQDSTDALTFSAAGLPPGLSINPTTGIISGTIDKNASQTGPYSVTVTANDGHGGTVSTSFTWSVSNPGPTANNDTATTSEDTATTINVLSNDTDPDFDPLTVTGATAGNGTVSINPDGTIKYTPAADFNGTDTIVYQISDGNGGVSTATVSVTVTPVNDAPVTTGLDALIDNDASPIMIDISSAFSDIDGDTLTFAISGLPPGLSYNPTTGVVSGTIDPNASQPTGDLSYPITVTADDGHGGTVTTTFTWRVLNLPPTAEDDSVTTPEDTPVVAQVLTNDHDPDHDPLTITEINGQPITLDGPAVTTANGSVQLLTDAFGTQILLFTPNANFNGVESLVYKSTDGNSGFDTATLTITVVPQNDAPTADTLANLSNLDSDVVSVPLGSFFHDIDAPDGDTLTFTAIGLPAGLTIDAATGTISGAIDHAASQNGPYTVVVTATDSAGAPVSQTFTWTVTNPAPTAVDDVQAVVENTSLSVDAAAGVLANDTDPDHDPLTVQAINGNTASVGHAVAGSSGGLFTVNADGSYTFDDNGDFEDLQNGETRQTLVTYRLADGNGGFATATLTITVSGSNDAPVATAIEPLTTIDSAPLSLNAAAAFTDVDADTLTYTASGMPAGLSIDANTGMITGTIDHSASQGGAGGVYTVTVTADDGHGGVTPVTFTISITNPAPNAGDDVASTNEDTQVSGSVTGNDSDPDGDPLTYAKASDPANGSVVVNANGTYTYTPNQNFNGTDSFTYTVTDSDGAVKTQTVTITVNPVNDAPTNNGPIPPQTVQDGDPINANISGLFQDVDGDTLAYAATGLPAGLSFDPSTGQITGTIDPHASQINGGHYTVVYTATDPDGLATSVSIDVTVINPAPISAALADRSGIDGSSANIPTASAFSDLDGDTLSYSATGLPAGLSIDPATGLITGTLTSAASAGGPLSDGVYTITVTANDGEGGTTSQSFTYTVANPAPTAGNDTFNGNEDADITGSVTANDQDPDGDAVSYAVVTGPAHGSLVFNSNGTFTYTPDGDYNGADGFTYKIVDAQGKEATATVTLGITPVNDAPGPATTSITTPEDTALSGTLPSSDADGDSVDFTLDTAPSHGTVVVHIDGTYTYTPSANYNGPDTFVVALDDGNGGVTLQTVSVTVTPVNDAPVANSNSYATSEDTALTIAASGILGNDTDVDHDPLTAVLVTGPAHGTLTLNADGSFTYTPNADCNGPDSFTYRANDGALNSNIATVSINVTPVNDAPVATDNSYAVTEDTAVSGNVLTDDTGSGVDSDIDSAITVTKFVVNGTSYAAGTTAHLTEGDLIIDADGSFTFTPAANYNGAVPVATYTVSDGTLTDTADLVLGPVTPVNDAPVANSNSYATSEDTALTIAASGILGNDTDIDHDPLTAVLVTGPAHGTLTLNADGSFTYTPNADYNGPDSFTYRANDGALNSNIATVSINVTPVNDAPVATDNSYAVTEDTAVSGNVLTDDTDSGVDSDIDSAITVTKFVVDGTTYAAGTTAHLTEGDLVINANGSFTFTPAANYNGAVPVATYTVFDGTLTDTADLVLGPVTPVNDAPVANPDSRTVTEDTPASGNVLGNDTDVEHDTLAVTDFTVNGTTYAPGTTVNLAEGDLKVDGNGTWTFTPAANYNGPVPVISYSIDDGHGGTDTSTLTLNVSPMNDPPVAVDDNVPVAEDAPVSGNVLGNDEDTEHDTLSVVDFTVNGTTYAAGTTVHLAEGDLSIAPDGAFTFSPALNYNGAVPAVTYTVSDGNGADTGALNLGPVSPVNDAPVAQNDVYAGNEDTAITGKVLVNDADVDHDVLSVVDTDGNPANGITPVSGPAHGSLVINPDGTFSYTPDANFHGTDSFTYRISDGNGGVAEATVTLDVAPVNDAPVAGNGALTTPEDQPFSGTLPPASDVDGDALSYGPGATKPSHGTVTIHADGTYTYVPNRDYNGPDTFTYRVTDGTTVVERTITVLVTPVNDAPVIAPITPPISEDGSTISFDTAQFTKDIDGGDLTFSAAGLPPGLSLYPHTGLITGKLPPGASQNGPYTVTLTVSDGHGGVVSRTFSWPVTNPPPQAADDTAAVKTGKSVSVDVLENDADRDGDPLTVMRAKAGNGTVEILPDGSIKYTPKPGFVGVDTITYVISDGNGGTAIATVKVTVADDAVAPKLPVFGYNGPERHDGNELASHASHYEPIGAEGAVINAVFSIDQLNSLAGQLTADGAVLAAANGARSLGGITMLSSNRSIIEVLNSERAREIEHRVGWQRQTSIYDIEGLPGFSLKRDVPGNLGGLSSREQIIVESLVRGRTLILQLSNSIVDGRRSIVDYKVTQLDGTAVPGWLDRVAKDLLIGERSANSEILKLRIEAVYSDGSVVVEEVRIDTATGEIQALAASKQGALAPKLFGDQFRIQTMLSPDQIQVLGRAIAR